MPEDLQPRLDRAVAALRKALGSNLRSCCVYGSVVRGNYVEGKSDINLLLVLQASTPDAHRAIADAMKGSPNVDPFVLGTRGFARSVRAFAPKFESIRRHYRVIYGEDPLADIKTDARLDRFLCEQAIRNLRLRLSTRS
jgi:predicted nucleotidyltransferase